VIRIPVSSRPIYECGAMLFAYLASPAPDEDPQQSRPHPHRAGLRKAQNPGPQGRRENRRGNLETYRHIA
jgi:hypothetical protein